jgi:hypothetical protein
MIIDPISAGLGIISGGLGIFQGIAGNQAQQQDYLNQSAFANANAAYARWQASMNARMQDTNNQFAFWQQTVSYNQDLAYVQSLRNFELAKSIEQAKVVAQTRTAAGANYIQQSEALNQQIQEKAMGDAVALQQYRMQVLRSSSAVQAMASEGRSVDRLVNDYARQEGDFSTLQQINQGLYSRQMQREKVAAVTQYLQNYNSQQFYTEQPYMDPIAPFPPLPTLIQPPPPSMTGGRPADMSGWNIATGVLGGFNTYFNSSANLSKYRGGGGGGGVLRSAGPTNRTGLAFSGINLMG